MERKKILIASVFDGRIAKDINIFNSLCDKHNTICKNCNNLVNGCCSEKCKNSGKMRKKIPDYYNIMSSNKNLMLK